MVTQSDRHIEDDIATSPGISHNIPKSLVKCRNTIDSFRYLGMPSKISFAMEFTPREGYPYSVFYPIGIKKITVNEKGTSYIFSIGEVEPTQIRFTKLESMTLE